MEEAWSRHDADWERNLGAKVWRFAAAYRIDFWVTGRRKDRLGALRRVRYICGIGGALLGARGGGCLVSREVLKKHDVAVGDVHDLRRSVRLQWRRPPISRAA